jgi:hypothetical protein
MFESAAPNPPRCRHRTQTDVEPPGPVRQILQNEWEQRAENPGADAVEQLDGDQPVLVVGQPKTSRTSAKKKLSKSSARAVRPETGPTASALNGHRTA